MTMLHTDDSVHSARRFGCSVGGVCAGLAAWSLWRGRTVPAGVLATSALLLLVPATVAPTWLRGPNRAWRALSHALGWVNSRVVLSALFIIVFTPIAWIRRMFGADSLRRRRQPGVSGWAPYAPRLADTKHYERMY